MEDLSAMHHFSGSFAFPSILHCNLSLKVATVNNQYALFIDHKKRASYVINWCMFSFTGTLDSISTSYAQQDHSAIFKTGNGELSLSRKRSESLSRRVMAIKFGETFREGSQLLTVKSFGSPSALIAIGYLHFFPTKN